VVGGFPWGEDTLVIREHCFGVGVEDVNLRLSREHTEYRWVYYDEARSLLHWDSNKSALWEIDVRLSRQSGASSA